MPTVYSLPWFYQQFCDENGVPLAGGYIETKAAGTSDDKATYSEFTGTTPHANPVVLDASGMPDAGPIFLQAGPYDFYVYDTDDNLKATIEGINALNNTVNVDTVDDLMALSAGQSPVVQTLGYSAINDGGGWWYYWSATSTATDDGGGVIQPDSLPATGRWLAIIPSNREINVRIFGATCDGTTDDIAELQACDDWCDTNSCIILIDSNIYVATDPSLTSKIKLLPSAQFRYGDINPVLDVIIDGNDKTQHFNCAEAYIPTLNVNELYPEWFGEDSTTHPIMTAAIAALTGEKTKYLRSVDVEGAFDITGNATIQNGTIDGLVLGADSGGSTLTDDTDKLAVVSVPGYDTDEPETSIIACSNGTSSSILSIGGSVTGKNAVTEIRFLTFTNNYTEIGALRGYFTKDGAFVVGSPTGAGGAGSGTINAEAVYDDGVLLTGYVLDKAYNPDFSLEKWNKITRGIAGEFDKRANTVLDIDNHCNFIEENRVLPTFEEIEKNERRAPTGEMIQKLWEVVEIQSVHIKQLNDRLKILEESCK